MRYGVLSDIHGNLPALQRVLEALEREGVDGYLCLGDIVGYGPCPNACVSRVAELGAVTVAGNHDLMAIGRLPSPARDAASATLRWTSSVLTPDAQRFLGELPLSAAVPDGVVLAHGALGDPARYVASPADAAEQLRELARRHPRADVLLLGHTHANLAYSERRGTQLYLKDGAVALPGDDRFLLNPGQVGQSRERGPLARALVLDLDARSARFLKVSYDVEAVRASLRRHALPATGHHVRPPLWRSAPARRLRRRLAERRVRRGRHRDA